MVTVKEFEREILSCRKGTGFWKKFTKEQRKQLCGQYDGYEFMYSKKELGRKEDL